LGQISLRPELVTSGGEACGIMLDEQYVGSLTLLYREEDRVWGTVQLDEEVLNVDEKEEIDMFIHRYVENMIDAVGAPECIVTSTYSMYDHIISTDNLGEIEELIEVESGDIYANDAVYDDYEMLEDGVEYAYEEDIDDIAEIELDDEDYDYDLEEEYYLNIVGENRNKVEYQLLNRDNELIAEAMLHLNRGDIEGDVFWHYDPTDDEIDEVAQVIVSDFDPDQVDTFTFSMYYREEEIATIELTHEDFLDDDEEVTYDDIDVDLGLDDELYVDVYADEDIQLYFDLIRDDVDTMTFDIYEEDGRRNSRLGMVTLDLNGDEPTALVDFVNPRDQQVREQIAYRLIEELDKEAIYESFTITMQYQNEVIDEYTFEISEQPNRIYC
jgi:hypothetical protein